MSMPTSMRATLFALVAATVSPPAAWSAVAVPPATFGDARADLNAADAGIVAWTLSRPGAAGRVQALVFRADAPRVLTARTIGSGRVLAARLAPDGARAVVMTRRAGRVVAIVRRSGRWRPEVMPAAAVGQPVAVEFMGRRIVLALRDRGRVRVVLRGPSGGWRVAGTLPTSNYRSIAVQVGETSGVVVAAWGGLTQGVGTVTASVWRPGTSRWSAPQVVVASAVGIPAVVSAHVNRRGDAALLVAPYPGLYAYGPGLGGAQAALLRAGTTDWDLAPPARIDALGVTAAGTLVGAWLARSDTDSGITRPTIRVRRWSSGPVWSPARTVVARGDSDTFALDAVTDVEVLASGRAAVVFRSDPGPAPDNHYAAIEASPGGPFGRYRFIGSVYGIVPVVPGGRGAAAIVVSDRARGSMPVLTTVR